MNYLRTTEDEISFIKALCKQMNSDGVIAAREEAFIRAKSGNYGIST